MRYSRLLAATFAATLLAQAPPPIDHLLRQAGMQVAVSPGRTRSSHELRVRWLSQQTASGKPSPGQLHFIARTLRNDPPPRQRSSEISSDQLVIAVLDSQGTVRSWQIVTDPRLIRGEFPDAYGNLHKTVLYRNDVEFDFSLPDGIDAAEVRVLAPTWTSEGELKLSLLTSLKLTGGARQ